MASLIHVQLSNQVLGAAFTVHNALGPGLLESAYAGAMEVELRYRRLSVERERIYPLRYRGEHVGDYIADLVVDNTIILELKAVRILTDVMESQLINYLRISGLPVGYLINFAGPRVHWRRFINTRQTSVRISQ